MPLYYFCREYINQEDKMNLIIEHVDDLNGLIKIGNMLPLSPQQFGYFHDGVYFDDFTVLQYLLLVTLSGKYSRYGEI